MIDPKILLFCATQKGYYYLEYFIQNDLKHLIAGVFSFEEKNVSESYYQKIEDLCSRSNLTFFNWRREKDQIEKIIIETQTTHVIMISWGFLLSTSLTKLLKSPIIVYHDSLLPRYRGFSPLPTAIINGEEEVGFTILLADEEMDAGNILFQKSYPLPADAYIKEITEQISEGYANSIPELLEILRLEFSQGIPQDNSKATYSIWRDLEDMKIDWGKSAKEIYNFIRALGPPYRGAYSYYGDVKIYIYKSTPVEDVYFESRHPGKIWKSTGSEAIIVCGEGMLKVEKVYDSNGQPFNFNRLRMRLK